MEEQTQLSFNLSFSYLSHDYITVLSLKKKTIYHLHRRFTQAIEAIELVQKKKMVLPKTMKQTPRETQTIFLSVTTKLALRTQTMDDHLELSEAAGLSQTAALSAAPIRKNAGANLKKGQTPLKTL